MNLARVKMLEEFLKDEPDNPFNLYALALEFIATDRSRAQRLFDQLLNDHPSYVPTYYHAGNFYLTLGDTEKAEQIFIKGIGQAQVAGDKKAEGELRGMVENL